MIQVTEKLTRQVAELARLELSDSEVQSITRQIGDILKYVDLLQSVDVSGVEPLLHPVSYATPLREDVVRPSPVDEAGRPKTLKPGPEVIEGGFKVPQIL